MNSLVNFMKTWGQLLVAFLALVMGGGWLKSYFELRSEKRKTEKRIFMFYRAVFDRPAFRGPYRWNTDHQPFKKAIDDTILAMKTGYLRTRSGEKAITADEVWASSIPNRARRAKVEEVKESLNKIHAIMQNPQSLYSDMTYLRFQASDLKNAISFVLWLKEGRKPLAPFILEQFSQDARKLVHNYPDREQGEASSPIKKDLREALANELNQMLQGSSFYDEKWFKCDTLSSEIKALIQQGPVGKDIVLRNRQILENVFKETYTYSLFAFVIAIDRERDKVIGVLNPIWETLKIRTLELPTDSINDMD